MERKFYRPPDKTDEDYLNKVKEEISTIKEKHRRDIFVIGGDFNLPDINWKEQTIINRQYPIKTNQTFHSSMWIFWAVSALYII
jgi:methylmalonyl-CoA mutase cobalamin-binding subunit